MAISQTRRTSRETSGHHAIFAVAFIFLFASVSMAQFGVGGRGARSWMDGSRLLRLKPVQEELELSEDQIAELKAAFNGEKSSESDAKAEGREASRRERPNFREMSDEQRRAYFDKTRQGAEERRGVANEKLKDILLPHQVRRLEQVKIQLMGTGALGDETVAKELELNDETKEKIKEVTRERFQEMRESMAGIFADGDRETIQEMIADMKKNIESAVMEVLNEQQKAKLKELKGPPISFSPESLMGEMFGGGRGR